MDSSPGFGSMNSDFVALFRLGFPSAPRFRRLTLPDPATRRTVLQKVRGHTLSDAPTVCKHRVSGSLSLPSRGPFHLSFTVLFSIGHQGVFSLWGWSPFLPARFLVSCGTLDPAGASLDSLTGLSPFLAGLSSSVLLPSLLPFCSPYPFLFPKRFGLLPFRSPLLRKSMFLSFPPAT